MPFKRIVVKVVSCPRCNAGAQLRAEEEHGELAVVYTVCNKCKLHKYFGLMTKKNIALVGKEMSLMKLIDETDSVPKKQRLSRQLNGVRNQIKFEHMRFGGVSENSSGA